MLITSSFQRWSLLKISGKTYGQSYKIHIWLGSKVKENPWKLERGILLRDTAESTTECWDLFSECFILAHCARFNSKTNSNSLNKAIQWKKNSVSWIFLSFILGKYYPVSTNEMCVAIHEKIIRYVYYDYSIYVRYSESSMVNTLKIKALPCF